MSGISQERIVGVHKARTDTLATLSVRITELEDAKLRATRDRLSVNPDDEAEYDAACDAHDAIRSELEKAYKLFHTLWAASHEWDPIVPAVVEARSALRVV